MLNRVDLASVDLNLLVVFEAVFETRHVRKAGAQLHVTPSAVSHGLGRLRELFGDPLFLRTPKGVVPSARGLELSQPIREILSHVRNVVSTRAPFDARVSKRRFTLAAADATSAFLLPALMAILRREAPLLDLAVRQQLPTAGLSALDDGADVLVLPLDGVPPRYFCKVVMEDDWVIVARRGHPFLKAPTLRRYCDCQHALVSTSGEGRGHIDELLAEKGLTRRVALTAPNFMLAFSALTDSDLVAAAPITLVRLHAARFGLASVKAPFAIRRWQLRAVVPKVALADAGVAWLLAAIERAAQGAPATAAPRAKAGARRARRVIEGA